MAALRSFLVAAIGVLCLISVGRAGEPKPGESVNGLQAVLSARESAYVFGEPIRITCRLRNVSDKILRIFPWHKPLQPPLIVVSINGPLDIDSGKLMAEEKERRWPLRNAAGQMIEPGVEPDVRGTFQDSELVTLRPGEEWSTTDDLNAYFRIITPGRYVLKAEYYSDRGTKLRLPDEWSGTMVSNSLTIEIIPAP